MRLKFVCGDVTFDVNAAGCEKFDMCDVVPFNCRKKSSMIEASKLCFWYSLLFGDVTLKGWLLLVERLNGLLEKSGVRTGERKKKK